MGPKDTFVTDAVNPTSTRGIWTGTSTTSATKSIVSPVLCALNLTLERLILNCITPALTTHLLIRTELNRNLSTQTCLVLNFHLILSIVIVNVNIQMSIFFSEKPYKCFKCNKTYKYKNNMLRHARYECDGISHFQCSLCSKAYTQKSGLKMHYMNTHDVKMRHVNSLDPLKWFSW